jgi:hypothetical protein
MITLGNLTIVDWLGWNNPNTCFVSYWKNYFNKNKDSINFGFVIFPLHFWHFFELPNVSSFGTGHKRFGFGLGFFHVFWDLS